MAEIGKKYFQEQIHQKNTKEMRKMYKVENVFTREVKTSLPARRERFRLLPLFSSFTCLLSSNIDPHTLIQKKIKVLNQQANFYR